MKIYKSVEECLNAQNKELELRQVQKKLDADNEFVQSNQYCVVEPGLTSFNPDQIISHQVLLDFLTKNYLDEIDVLSLSENV